MRPRLLSAAAVVATLLCAAALGLALWVEARVPEPRFATLGAVYAIATAATGALLVHLRPRNAIGWLLVLDAALQALSVGSAAYGSYGVDHAERTWPLAAVVAQVGSLTYLPSIVLPATVLVAVYPSGRLPAPWWRWPVRGVWVGLLLITVGGSLGQEAYDDIASGPAPVVLPDWVGPLFVVPVVALLAGGVTIWLGTAVRLVRARPPERQQLAWLVCVVVPLMAAAFFLPVAPTYLFVPLAFLVPGSVLVGVVRYRLLGIVLTRALVYAALTAAVLAVYLGVAAVAASVLGRTLSPIPGVVVAALLAVGLSPVRSRLQAWADRFVYGRRGDPVAAVTELGDRVAAAPETELLPAVLATVTDALHAPAAHVVPPGGAVDDRAGVPVPLRVAGADVGTLVVAERHPGERYTPGDLRLLAALAPQVAVVVRALELTASLEAERTRVLTATHAERDRIRRDLHDGLGPSLAGIGLGLQAVQAQVGTTSGPAVAPVLSRLRDEVDSAVAEVRRILDGLRPAPLDDLGVVAAVRRHADTLGPVLPVRVTAGTLPPLPPEVETAAYRIASEALTNAVRHSGARSAEVGLRARDGRLEVAVVDDGAGFSPEAPSGTRPAGVGLASMRSRAREVGGELTVTSGPGGTRVLAGLPLEGQP